MNPEILVRPDNHHVSVRSETFVLSVDRSVFWLEQGMLIISDLHLGKAGHFRKHGIPIPRQVHISDFQRINSLIERFQPKTILYLGDLFHSVKNDEWDDFVFWSVHQKHLQQILVAGNHDKSTLDLYAETQIKVVDEFNSGPFLFTHEPVESAFYNLAGHIHPAVRIQGLARQGMTLPCFYFGKKNGILPAFGNFTGNHPVRPVKGDVIFAIADDILVELKG